MLPAFVYTTPFPPNGIIQQVDFFQNTATRRKSGANLGYVYTEVVICLFSAIQQTSFLGKIILQTLRGGKPIHGNFRIFSLFFIPLAQTHNWQSTDRSTLKLPYSPDTPSASVHTPDRTPSHTHMQFDVR